MGKPLYVSPVVQLHNVVLARFRRVGVWKHRRTLFHPLLTADVVRSAQQSTSDVTKGEALFIARIRMDSALFDPSELRQDSASNHLDRRNDFGKQVCYSLIGYRKTAGAT